MKKNILFILAIVFLFLIPAIAPAWETHGPGAGSTSGTQMEWKGTKNSSDIPILDGTTNPVSVKSGTPDTHFSSAVQLTSGSGTITQIDKNHAYVICTSTCTVTAKTPTAGTPTELCAQNDVGSTGVITLAMPTGVMISNQGRTAYGTAGPSHGLTSGGTATDQVCIVSKDATHYNQWSATGSWNPY
jgi:hypothetical protein